MVGKYFAIIDCNNFYVSCERLFCPKARNRPVAVLSNNDGCIVARSNELKEAKIPMGAPFFQYKNELENMGAIIFSSNYALYQDLSDRVMSTILIMCDEMEIYSVDEAFVQIYFSDENQVIEWCRQLRKLIYDWTGIPVSIGVSKTKTLAKVANYLAKKESRKNPNSWGVKLINEQNRETILSEVEVGEIWGVGRKYAKKLNQKGIFQASDLLAVDDVWLKNELKLNGQIIKQELLNKPYYSLESERSAKKGIASTRSFSSPQTEISAIKESVSEYVAIAGEKLRKQKQFVSKISVFLMTNRFREDFRFVSESVILEEASDYTPEITKVALKSVEKLFQKGLKYTKAGVYFTGLSPVKQENLFTNDEEKTKKEAKRMRVVDFLNRKYGKNSLKLLSSGLEKRWAMKRQQISPRYTTSWREILEVKN